MDVEENIRRLAGEVIAQRTGVYPRVLEIERRPLGGAEATETALVTARYRDGQDRPRMLRAVLKRLHGRPAREAGVYESLVAHHAASIAPEVLSVEKQGPDEALILLEAVRRANLWPWRDASATAAMLTRLGEFHAMANTADVGLPVWDYEAELSAMAEPASGLLDQCRKNPELVSLGRELPKVDRMIQALPRLRRQLFAERPFGYRPIHGDVHPGNAMVRRRRLQPVLIDWGRARFGSPLEDVSSWLQSLRFWEFEAQRQHDTLFRAYLSAFGVPRHLGSNIRAAYWIAGASNALAGALVHHLVIAMDGCQRNTTRATSFRAAHDWLRIVRRAYAWTM